MREVRAPWCQPAAAVMGGLARSRDAAVSDRPIEALALPTASAPTTGRLLYASGLRRQTIRCDRFRRGRSRDALCSFEHHQFSVRGSVRYPKALFASAAAMVGGVVIDARTRWSFEYVVLSLVHDGRISGIGCSGNNLCMDAFARRPLRD